MGGFATSFPRERRLPQSDRHNSRSVVEKWRLLASLHPAPQTRRHNARFGRHGLPAPRRRSDSQSFSQLLVERRKFLVTGLVGRHDMGTRAALLSLLNQIGQSLIDQGLKLSTFTLGDVPPLAQAFRI